MWAKLKGLRITKDGEKEEMKNSVQVRNLNLNEEYLSAFKTKSYAEISAKAQSLFNKQPFSSSFCSGKISDLLLEPAQATITTIINGTILTKNPDLKGLIHNYFDISAEASKICSHLLTSIKQIQSNYKLIQRVLDLVLIGEELDCSQDWNKMFIISQLRSFNLLTNPFSTTNNYEFKLFHDRYSSVLRNLKAKRKKIARKIKLIKYIKKGSEICLTTACGVLAVATITLAAHSLFGLVMGPTIFSFPFMNFMKKKTKNLLIDFRSIRSGFLRKLGLQLDVAAKGAYILNRDFDTMSRLVSRLHDEIEHSKEIVKFCLDRKEDRFPLQEVVKELRKSDNGFRKQVEELEEHVYLCLVTINRARSLVIQEMATESTRQ